MFISNVLESGVGFTYKKINFFGMHGTLPTIGNVFEISEFKEKSNSLMIRE
jgi:hypothetical protein